MKNRNLIQAAVFSALATASLLVVTSAQAYDCVVTKTGIEACLALPDEAITLAPATMASANELSGGALDVENKFRQDTSLNPATQAEINTDTSRIMALREANSTLNQLRWIETFLKSGPASGGDLTVISAGKK